VFRGVYCRGKHLLNAKICIISIGFVDEAEGVYVFTVFREGLNQHDVIGYALAVDLNS
jgi:hypothetical protein